jgi:Cytochrome c oxidase biogenesis protein Cmc1 like
MSDRANQIRDDGRASRLSFRNFAEHQIRSEFKEEAMVKCKPHVDAFAQCAKEKGLGVVWYCRHLNKAITDCMYIYNSDEAFAKYLEDNPQLLENRTIHTGPVIKPVTK